MCDLSKDILYSNIREILTSARTHLCSVVNSTMVQTYWNVGRLIVEDEQRGEVRAEYGKQLVKEFSLKLKGEFCKGFSVVNLKDMRKFYLYFNQLDRKRYALSAQLSWTHYRTLMRIEDQKARDLYNVVVVEEYSTFLDKCIDKKALMFILKATTPAGLVPFFRKCSTGGLLFLYPIKFASLSLNIPIKASHRLGAIYGL